jgi:hypothetical protein
MIIFKKIQQKYSSSVRMNIENGEFDGKKWEGMG